MNKVQPSNGASMPVIDELDSPDAGKWLSPEDKAKLIRELKERLKEIERLKRELGMAVQSTQENSPNNSSTTSSSPPSFSSNDLPAAEDDSSHPVSTGRVAEEVEELRVPALEMLEDKPFQKKKKAGNAT